MISSSIIVGLLFEAFVVVSIVLTCIAWRRFIVLMRSRRTICYGLPVLMLGAAGIAIFMGSGVIANPAEPPVNRLYFLTSLAFLGFGWTAWPASVSLIAQARRIAESSESASPPRAGRMSKTVLICIMVAIHVGGLFCELV